MMLSRYGSEPIRIDKNDIRRREMMTVGSSDKHHERKQYSLNTSVTLVVNWHEFKHMNKKRPEIGFHWYEADKRRMFLFIWGRVTGGLPATHAIYDYYAMHDIEEDDFPMDTSERLWKRWRVEKEKERGSFSPYIVPRNFPVLFAKKQAESITNRVQTILANRIIKYDPRYKHALMCFILYRSTSLTLKDVGNLLGSSERHTWRSIKRCDSYLRYNKDLRKIVAYCVVTTRARPTPST